MIDESLQKRLEFYEKIYFTLDEPVPFKSFYIYPVLAKDYYKFYSFFSCLTLDKNTKPQKYYDEKFQTEKTRLVSNPKGIGMSYLAYLISLMEDQEFGQQMTSCLISLLELVLHEKNGLFCPKCGKQVGVLTYENISKQLINSTDEEKLNFFRKEARCPICGEPRREVFSIKDSGVTKKLCVYNTELNAKDFDELKSIIAHQNILDYDGDKYIDPTLKEDLEKKKRLENKDYSSPTLEKQLVCIASNTAYTFQDLKNISIRKITYLLRVIDAKCSYYAQIQGQYSGMVKFKEDPKHWIFSDNSRDVNKEIMLLDDFKQKFKNVT